jgi:hypothetical protein
MIISCSRRTDIPAFYSDWFFNRLREGYVLVRNPMNSKQVRNVSLTPANVDCLVFWTKNPAPMLDKLHLLHDYKYYFQFTLTPYGKDIEPHLPPKTQIIDTFLKLSDKIGTQRILWRYDPILLCEGVNIEYHLDHFEWLAKRLSNYTGKCIISFIDLYRHVQTKLSSISISPPDESEIKILAKKIAQVASANNIIVETCAEKVELANLGIKHSSCIDECLISELIGTKLKIEKDKNQRGLCGCASSIDIGEYNTCSHKCCYCYANSSQKTIEKHLSLHNVKAPLLVGKIRGREKIVERKSVSVLTKQLNLLV